MTVINEKTIFSFLSVKNKKFNLNFLFFSVLSQQIMNITDEININMVMTMQNKLMKQ
jgi:hypothetical protein